MRPRDPLTGHDRDCPCEQCLDAHLVHALAEPQPFFAEQLQDRPAGMADHRASPRARFLVLLAGSVLAWGLLFASIWLAAVLFGVSA